MARGHFSQPSRESLRLTAAAARRGSLTAMAACAAARNGSAPSGTVTYEYDEFERMTGADGERVQDTLAYAYDALDRRRRRVE